MLLFRCLTYSSNEITETTKTPIIIQVKVMVESEFVLGEVVPLLGKESVGDGVGVGFSVGIGEFRSSGIVAC